MISIISDVICEIKVAVKELNDTIDILDKRISRIEKFLAEKEGEDNAVQDQETDRSETLEDHKV